MSFDRFRVETLLFAYGQHRLRRYGMRCASSDRVARGQPEFETVCRRSFLSHRYERDDRLKAMSETNRSMLSSFAV